MTKRNAATLHQWKQDALLLALRENIFVDGLAKNIADRQAGDRHDGIFQTIDDENKIPIELF